MRCLVLIYLVLILSGMRWYSMIGYVRHGGVGVYGGISWRLGGFFFFVLGGGGFFCPKAGRQGKNGWMDGERVSCMLLYSTLR